MNNLACNSGKNIKESTSISNRSAFLFLIQELNNAVENETDIANVRDYIVNSYLPEETILLRKLLKKSEISNTRLVFRPNGKISFRLNNTHITHEAVKMAIGSSNPLFNQIEAITHIYRAISSLCL